MNVFEVVKENVTARQAAEAYAMLTKGVDYDPKKMVSDIKRPAAYLQTE